MTGKGYLTRAEIDTAGPFLRLLLAAGPLPAKEVRQTIDAAGFSWWSARRVPGIEKRRTGFGAGSVVIWRLADGGSSHSEHVHPAGDAPSILSAPSNGVATPKSGHRGAIPERIVRFHDGYGWTYGVAGTAGRKHIPVCLSDATSVRMVRVPKEEARHFVEIDYDLGRWCRLWLRPRSTLGHRREITRAARAFLEALA
jgi:hypothetical protein